MITVKDPLQPAGGECHHLLADHSLQILNPRPANSPGPAKASSSAFSPCSRVRWSPLFRPVRPLRPVRNRPIARRPANRPRCVHEKLGRPEVVGVPFRLVTPTVALTGCLSSYCASG